MGLMGHCKANIHMKVVPKGEKREKETGSLFKEVVAHNFPNLGEEIDIQI